MELKNVQDNEHLMGIVYKAVYDYFDKSNIINKQEYLRDICEDVAVDLANKINHELEKERDWVKK